MHLTRLFTRRFWHVLSPILAVGGLVSAFVLMPGIVGAALKSSHPAIPATGEILKHYPAQGPNGGMNPLLPHNNTVITQPRAYLIFEGADWQSSYSLTQTNQERVYQYFTDVNGSTFEGILSQYSGISNSISVAGSALDLNFSYSHNCLGSGNVMYDPGSTSSPNDMTDEITKEIRANPSWTNTTSTIFFVFTPNTYSVLLGACVGVNPSCGYHIQVGSYLYAVIPWGGGGCGTTDGNAIDTDINTASHEQFEAITNPDATLLGDGSGWYNTDCNPQLLAQPLCEIGDKCENNHPVVYLNGTFYPGVQGEYNNASHDCVYPDQPPPPTPTPTNTPVTTCAATNETDNIEPGGTYTDNRGNTWHVYYDIKRDSVTNNPCQMQVVVRIWSPSPNGTWNGTAAVFAERGGGYLSASFGKVNGSGTYQYHFVWRGPWFSVSSGSYLIEDTEYNGSNPYTRAVATFSI